MLWAMGKPHDNCSCYFVNLQHYNNYLRGQLWTNRVTDWLMPGIICCDYNGWMLQGASRDTRSEQGSKGRPQDGSWTSGITKPRERCHIAADVPCWRGWAAAAELSLVTSRLPWRRWWYKGGGTTKAQCDSGTLVKLSLPQKANQFFNWGFTELTSTVSGFQGFCWTAAGQ